jgi:hypothetical protein
VIADDEAGFVVLVDRPSVAGEQARDCQSNSTLSPRRVVGNCNINLGYVGYERRRHCDVEFDEAVFRRPDDIFFEKFIIPAINSYILIGGHFTVARLIHDNPNRNGSAGH